jgi:hypothetical protein
VSNVDLVQKIATERAAMLAPPNDVFVVDSCRAALDVFESALRNPTATSEALAAALEAIAIAEDVADLFDGVSARRAWEFYLAAVAIRSNNIPLVVNAVESLWSVCSSPQRELDRPTLLLILGIARHVILQAAPRSEFFEAHLVPFVAQETDSEV